MTEGPHGAAGARARAANASGTQFAARLGSLLGSPLTLATCVVVLVTSVGALATGTSYLALRRLGRERAENWLHLRSGSLKASLGDALGAADPLLDQLAREVKRQPSSDAVEPLLTVMYALSAARAGLAWTSVSFPDGTFVGVYRRDDGSLHGQETRLSAAGGIERQLALDASGRVRETARKATEYDPRTRDFYRRALAQKRRSWTPPYPFFTSLRTGVTRVEPLYERPGDPESLRAVLTVDFDASELAKLLGDPLLPSQRTLVVSSDGVLVASAGVKVPPRERLSRLRPLSWADLDDPVVRGMRSAGAERSEHLTRTIEVEGEPFRVDGVRLADLDGVRITLLSAVAERELYTPARRQARQGVLATGSMTLLGIVLSLLLSANIARLRRKRELAEAAAQRAHDEVIELGSYELIEQLGSGAMGEVYRARHKLLAREAALKLIKADGLGAVDDERSARFFQEARRLASMRCVHTVSVYDFGVADDGRYFLAMELLTGLDLDTLVRRYGKQPPARVATILAQICDSLSEAHDAHLVHQDVKPANVFLCRLAESLDFVKVLDFGLSRAVDPLAVRERTSIEGTPAFMAPEQVLGERVGPEADLYALGCIGFFLLAGRPPYVLSDIEALLSAHVKGPLPELPGEVLEGTPRALCQLLTRCLAKRPEHRPVSARVLAEAFRNVAVECAATFTVGDCELWWTRHLAQTADSAPGTLSEPAAPNISTVAQRLYTHRRQLPRVDPKHERQAR